MTSVISSLARRAGAAALAAALGSAFSSPAGAVAICQKTSKTGKLSFKLRETCNVAKGETEVSVGTRTQVFHSFSDSQQEISTSDIALPIDGVNTSFSFETTAESSDVVITFSAGCQINDATGGGWVDLDLRVDGADVAPTDLPRNGFCFQVGASDETQMTNSYTVAVEDLAAGTHSVQAIVSNVAVTPNPFLGDVSLVVTVHEN
jgi:hypothetical protein